ncbi:hypothetical protein HF086_001278 [Spodoptera exigua]|uniref:Uncharacterized protein n=2 Tax=Spodoptera exigua TaxID=7107 RepID=A0A922MC80_SPOEX|nr:hypothetical protein HF086_001278 [Spodoptera exigua]
MWCLFLLQIHSRFNFNIPKANMMWWALWCAVVVAGGAGVAAAPAPDSLTPLDMVQMDSSAPDDESLYAMSPLAARYSAAAPWLYLLADMPRDSQIMCSDYKYKCVTKVATSGVEMRTRRSFSVNPAVELLQRGAYKKYLDTVARQNNREFFNRVGKRANVDSMVREDWQWSGETAHAFAVHRHADVCAASEGEPGKGEEGPVNPSGGQQELLERYRQARFPMVPCGPESQLLLNVASQEMPAYVDFIQNPKVLSTC